MPITVLEFFLRGIGNIKDAIYNFDKVIEIEKYNLTSSWLSMNTFPVIYEDKNQIYYYRKRYKDLMKKINRMIESKINYTKEELS